MARPHKDSIKIQPRFNQKQVQLIRSYKGVLGEDDAEIVKNIVTNWLLEKSLHRQAEASR